MKYSDLAADLLVEAADFFVRISEGKPEMFAQMEQNAGTFKQMAELIRHQPDGAVEELTHAEMAARLLDDAATFFDSIASTNPPIAEQMQQNSAVFRQIAGQLRVNPSEAVPE